MTYTALSKKSKRVAVQTALLFFLFAAVLGTILRFIYLKEIPFLDYKHVLHAHSHIAMMGWGFTALAVALVFVFIPKCAFRKVYRNVLIGNIIAGVGMLFAFLWQGYGAVSIGFCTLHLFVSYYFAWHFLKDLKNQSNTIAAGFAKWSVFLMILSTLGLWAIGPVGAFLGKLNPFYFASIQFFLHFQFNGWFTFGILALILKLVESEGREVTLIRGTLALLLASLVLTYALSITWSTPENILFYTNSVGVVLQIIAFILFAKSVQSAGSLTITWKSLYGWLLRVGLLSLAVKVIVQCAAAFPQIAEASYSIRNLVIGFIHLTMLGAVSISLVAILVRYDLLPVCRLSIAGYRLLVSGFILTEFLLFLQGVLLWAERGFISHYHSILFGATAILPVGILMIYIASGKRKSIQYLKL